MRSLRQVILESITDAPLVTADMARDTLIDHLINKHVSGLLAERHRKLSNHALDKHSRMADKYSLDRVTYNSAAMQTNELLHKLDKTHGVGKLFNYEQASRKVAEDKLERILRT